MTHRTVPRQESPAYILSAIVMRVFTQLACLIAIPFAIVAMLVFNACDWIRFTKAWLWFVGRSA